MSEESASGIATLNLDDFCRDVARALILLSGSFPQPRNVFVEDVYRAEETDEFGMHSERYLACFAALVWLGEEGYLRYTDVLKTEAIEQAVLTGSALRKLITPSSENLDERNTLTLDRNTLLARMRAALAQGSSTELRWAVLALLNKA